MVIVDVDYKPEKGVDGFVSLQDLENEHGAHGSGLVMKTPSGGRQMFFEDSDCNCRRKLGVRPGIDILGAGGYTIVPSDASPGREWIEGDFADADDLVAAPDWVQRMGHRPSDVIENQSLGRTVLSERRLEDLRAALAHWPNESRENWLIVGEALKGCEGPDGHSLQGVWEAWSARGNPPSYDPDTQQQQWDSFKPAAKRGDVTVNTIFYRARESFGWDGISATADGTEEISGRLMQSSEAKREQQTSWTFTPKREATETPPIEWLVKGLLARRSTSILAGEPGVGKSFLAMDLGLAISHGREQWMGEAIIHHGPVAYLALEGKAGLGTRLRAWDAYHESECQQHPFVIVEMDDRSPSPLGKGAGPDTMIRELKAWAESLDAPPALTVIDTLTLAIDGDENDSEAMRPAIRAAERLSRELACAVLLVHHLRKSHGEEPTLADLRGSGAIGGNTDQTLLAYRHGQGLDAEHRLKTGKAKEGRGDFAIRYTLQVVNTGRKDSTGDEESSCVPRFDNAVDRFAERKRREADEREAETSRIKQLRASAERLTFSISPTNLCKEAGMKPRYIHLVERLARDGLLARRPNNRGKGFVYGPPALIERELAEIEAEKKARSCSKRKGQK